MIKHLFNGLHTVLARGPGGLARVYMESLGWSCRSVLPKGLTARIQSSISQHTWPDMQFSAREVVVGNNTKIKIKPHLGEFDDVALFSPRLNYEDASFRWLEANAAGRYDVIIEIGANVGAFTVFFDALARRGARLKSVIAFEPSREAYMPGSCQISTRTEHRQRLRSTLRSVRFRDFKRSTSPTGI